MTVEEIKEHYKANGYSIVAFTDHEHLIDNSHLDDDDFLAWIEAQAKKAQADGKMMIAMEHYPVLAGQPILNLIPDARQKNGKKLIETLADKSFIPLPFVKIISFKDS